MTEFDTASRYRLTDAPMLAPGSDFLTGSGVGPFVDTGRDVQFSEVGRIYLSISTIQEMAEGAGLFDSLRAELTEAQNVGYQLGYADATKENIGGAITDLYTRLGPLADRLSASDVEAREPSTSRRNDDEPVVFVTDGDDSSRGKSGKLKGSGAAVRPARQGARAPRNKRPAGVSAGPSDVNLFRI